MSGPKVTVYTLTAEQRAIIAEERRRRQRELERRNQLAKSISDCISTVQNCIVHLHQYRLVADEASSTLSDTKATELLETNLSKAQAVINDLTTLKDSKDNDRMESGLRELSVQIEILKTAEDDMAKMVSELEPRLQAVLSERVSHLFKKAAPVCDAAETESAILSHARDRINYFLGTGHQNSATRRKLQEMLDGLAHGAECYGDTFIAIEVQPILQKCEAVEQLWAESGTEYTELLNQYEALSSEMGTISPVTIPFDENAVAKLKCEIALLEERAQKQAEDAYISQTLTDVMSEMGYTMWGNRSGQKKNGQHYINDLFRFSEETAISVTCSSDGRVALELGKVDQCDRLPSPVEGESLEKQMYLFCTQFKEIERRLATRGVILGNRLMMAPPSTEFAQIININDYKVIEQHADTRAQHLGQKKALQLKID